jgi:hypothetical protein
MKNILRGLNILVFDHFQGILLVMKILNGYLFCVVGKMNPLFLTTRSVGLTTSSIAQVGSSLDKKVTPEFLHTRSAPRVSRSENYDSRALEGAYSVHSCRDKSHNHNLRKKSKHVLEKGVK